MGLLDQDSAAPPQAPTRKKSALESVLPFTTVALVLALLYVAWTFYSRRQSVADEQAAAAKKEEDARKKQADLVFGSGEIKFLTFSVSPGHLKRGESAKLCYGVVNAQTLKIEPAIGEEVKPTSRHCADIAPKTTTTYTMTGSNAKGSNQVSLTIHVD